jgi:hypothetical protein
MTPAMFSILKRQAQHDPNARMLVERILKGLPLQGGKPIIVK